MYRLRNCLLLFTVVFSCVRASGQDSAKPKKIAVLLSPALVPMAPTKLALQPGMQVRLHKWSLTAQVAFPVQKPSPNFASTHYFRKSAELKRFFKQQKDLEEYLSAEVQYAERSFVDTNGGTYFKGRDEVRYRYSYAAIHSPIRVLMLKAGAEFPVYKRFFLDAFVGVGARTIYTRYSEVVNEEYAPWGWFELNGPKSAYRYDGTFSKPHIALGFKFGYILW